MNFTNKQLTDIYYEANGLDPKRHNSITTERIFAAMRAMPEAARKIAIEDSIKTLTDNDKCSTDGSLSKMLRKMG